MNTTIPLAMPRPPIRNPRLQDRDYDLLQHVLRYRLSTPEILHRLFFQDSDRNAVTKVTSKLCVSQFLLSHQLYAGYTYFTLGRRGAKVVGMSRCKTGPLGPQALYREYGTLAFCCRSEMPRERLRTAEIMRRHPEYISGRLDAGHYYLDEHESIVRLGYIWVEGAGEINHIVRTVQDAIIEQRRSVPALRQLIEEGRFVVSVVTLNDDKKSEIQRALNGLATTVFFRVEVVPELIHLLPSVWHE